MITPTSHVARQVSGRFLIVWAVVAFCGMSEAANAQTGAAIAGSGWDAQSPSLDTLVGFNRDQSDLRVAITRYESDRAALYRRYDVLYSPVLRDRLREFYNRWLDQLRALDFASINREGQVDLILLRNRPVAQRACPLSC